MEYMYDDTVLETMDEQIDNVHPVKAWINRAWVFIKKHWKAMTTSVVALFIVHFLIELPLYMAAFGLGMMV